MKNNMEWKENGYGIVALWEFLARAVTSPPILSMHSLPFPPHLCSALFWPPVHVRLPMVSL